MSLENKLRGGEVSKLVRIANDTINWRRNLIWGITDLNFDSDPFEGVYSFKIISTTGGIHPVWAGSDKEEAERLHKATIDMLEE
jgi:hypothetical protein